MDPKITKISHETIHVVYCLYSFEVKSQLNTLLHKIFCVALHLH
jgi:hypothetical protein